MFVLFFVLFWDVLANFLSFRCFGAGHRKATARPQAAQLEGTLAVGSWQTTCQHLSPPLAVAAAVVAAALAKVAGISSVKGSRGSGNWLILMVWCHASRRRLGGPLGIQSWIWTVNPTHLEVKIDPYSGYINRGGL